LANKLGWLHVDQMLEQMQPEEFEERWAHYRIRPWDLWEEWFARVAAVVHNVGTNLLGALTLTPPDEDQYKTEADFIPGEKPTKVHKRRMTPEEAEAVDRARYRRG
jgi:hypothetical protein